MGFSLNNYSMLKKTLTEDLYRIGKRRGISAGLKCYFFGEGFKYVATFRLCQYLKRKPFAKLAYYIFRFQLWRLTYKFGISIPVDTEIKGGFYIGHFGTIIVSSSAKIGKNCNISQGVTIGKSSRGKRAGAPVIGDNVYIGPGAIISGNISIANGAVIGAGAVVTTDIPENAVVAPSRPTIISFNGSDCYVNNTL